MKFQVGDKIKIPSKEHLLKHGWVELYNDNMTISHGSGDSLLGYDSLLNTLDCGNEIPIQEIYRFSIRLHDKWVNPEHLHLDDVQPEVEKKLLSAEDIKAVLARCDTTDKVLEQLGFTPPKVEKEVTFWVNIYDDWMSGNPSKEEAILHADTSRLKARKQITIKYFEGEGLE